MNGQHVNVRHTSVYEPINSKYEGGSSHRWHWWWQGVLCHVSYLFNCNMRPKWTRQSTHFDWSHLCLNAQTLCVMNSTLYSVYWQQKCVYTSSTVCLWQQNLAAVLEKEERIGLVNGKEDMVSIPTISSATSTVLKGLFMVLDFLYRDNSRSETSQTSLGDQNHKSCQFLRWTCSLCVRRFAEDYRVALQRSYAWTNQVPPDVPDAQGFLVRPRKRQRQSVRVKTEVLTLSFWCLNPAVVRG